MLASANARLAGELGPIETARALSGFRGNDEALDKILLTFVGVDSETDTLPLGKVRQHWNPVALEREDAKIARAEAWCREMVTDACRDLVKVLTPLLRELSDQQPFPR
jgi:hypothetical protein